MKQKKEQIASPLAGTVWKIQAKAGDTVEEGAVLIILESMKMEIPVEATYNGTVLEIHTEEGKPVKEGDVLVSLQVG